MSNPFWNLFGGGGIPDILRKPKVWAPGEREAWWESAYPGVKWQPWTPDLKWAPVLLIKGSTYAPHPLFPEVVPSRGGVETFSRDSTTHTASASGRWVYGNQILPAFGQLMTHSGRRKGTVLFDSPVIIPAIYERHSQVEYYDVNIMDPDYKPSDTFALPMRVERRERLRWYWKNIDYNGGVSPWMSLTPMEILTLRPGAAFAREHTVIAGLGLGWQLQEAAKNPKVTRITLLERDQEIVDFVLPRLTVKKPLDVVVGDAYETIKSIPADTALIDIFPGWGDISRKMSKFRAAAPHIKRWWGWGWGGKS